MNPDRTIRADQVQLCLVARKLRPQTRWAVMSNGAASNSCKRRLVDSDLHIRFRSMLGPMERGNFSITLDRVRSQGRREVLRTFGTGIRALQRECSSGVMHTGVQQ